jgi:hypothetical protein
MEAVHVQLPDKGCVVVMLEEFWDQTSGKLVFIQDNEGIAIVGPSDQLCVFRFIKETVTSNH